MKKKTAERQVAQLESVFNKGESLFASRVSKKFYFSFILVINISLNIKHVFLNIIITIE